MATAKISQVGTLRAITAGDLIETENAAGTSGRSALGTLAGKSAGAAVANSSATDLAGVNTTLNALLASLRAAGVIAS